MIVGIGTDILEIKRMEKKLDNQRFLDKVFTQKEQEYFLGKVNGAQSAAGIFCAKEAVLKTFKKGIGAINLTKIQILHHKGGAPYCLCEQCEEKIFISISHCKEYATAVAVREG